VDHNQKLGHVRLWRVITIANSRHSCKTEIKGIKHSLETKVFVARLVKHHVEYTEYKRDKEDRR